eukprot:CAMPEP_0174758870 /NCGR_PEP_ID=MMETSP1094-20130205/107986_1 /TAXON_ID=156173 /ORGANISM="Chrysochromulina brevifilum, Strain UTEX LB 985" /LENGTH=46 /DNA_ID= /DNA_START= /DNA_END= /DNA_ORIENTATION=
MGPMLVLRAHERLGASTRQGAAAAGAAGAAGAGAGADAAGLALKQW